MDQVDCSIFLANWNPPIPQFVAVLIMAAHATPTALAGRKVSALLTIPIALKPPITSRCFRADG